MSLANLSITSYLPIVTPNKENSVEIKGEDSFYLEIVQVCFLTGREANKNNVKNECCLGDRLIF